MLTLKNSFKGKIVGIISEIKKIQTKSKKTMAFIQIKDDINTLSVVVFPDTYEKNYSKLKINNPIIIDGYFDDKKDIVYIAKEIDLLEDN